MRNLSRAVVTLFFVLSAWAVSAAPVNINTADAEALARSLSGVGKDKAEAIVAYRETIGRFQRVEDLAKVKGIGRKTVEKNRANLVVEQPAH